MTDSRHEILEELARRRGLGEAYYDHAGNLFHFSPTARHAILASMGLAIDDESTLRRALTEQVEAISASATQSVPCYQPPSLDTDRLWGVTIQLYTLRSNRNWGIGDFGDLRELIALTSPLGCHVIGLNPLHALFPADPSHCSPYSPSNRFFLNVLYIDIESIPEFKTCASVREFCNQAAFQTALTAARATDNVMYAQSAALKLCTLRLLFADFIENDVPDRSPRAQAFAEFKQRGGSALRAHAIFDALDAHFRPDVQGGWRQWPAEFQEPDSQATLKFASEHQFDVEFFAYLQWIADEQLADVQSFARKLGMKIGLYGDLAVGANPDGSEVWSNQSLYAKNASIGAPPDPLALNGQDWGIPPIDPFALRKQGFIPFRELLRANMRHVGALRIDHVMSLFRLWWVPKSFGATDGVYVHYPLQELVGILVRESQEARCLVVGEDLGTVPDEMRDAMERYRLFHYKVVLFEKEGARFKSPSEYVRHAVATATTHDLPLLKAWWTGEDLTMRDALHLYPSADTVHRLRAERDADKRALLFALRGTNLWYWQDHESLPDYSLALARAIHLFVGESQAALTFVQLEDLIGMTAPVNIPGTHTEHDNWQRKLVLSTHDIFERPDVIESLAALSKARSGKDPNR